MTATTQTPAAAEPGYMPSYGVIPWSVLRALVAEAQMGVRDEKYCEAKADQGHQEVRMNWNSLNRIVSTFAALVPAAALGLSQAPDTSQDAFDAWRQS